MSTHPSFESNDEKAEYLKSLIVKGQKIMAIHFVRESEGMGLVDAKEKVEGIQSELSKLPEGHPDRPVQRQGTPDWVGPFMIIGLIILVVVLIYLSR